MWPPFGKRPLWHSDELIDCVLAFIPTRETVAELSGDTPANVVGRGFRTLVLNRTRRGGILATGASLARAGEAGKGGNFSVVPGYHCAAHKGNFKVRSPN